MSRSACHWPNTTPMKSEVLSSRTLGASKPNYSAFINPTQNIQVFYDSRVAPWFKIKQRITPVLK